MYINKLNLCGRTFVSCISQLLGEMVYINDIIVTIEKAHKNKEKKLTRIYYNYAPENMGYNLWGIIYFVL